MSSHSVIKACSKNGGGGCGAWLNKLAARLVPVVAASLKGKFLLEEDDDPDDSGEEMPRG